MSLRVTILGSGTSYGVPLIGCDCVVCRSNDPRNRRTRPGAMLTTPDQVILLDTPTDLRQQALAYGVPRVDAVLYTHAHADHVLGLDELRVFNFLQRSAIPCYGSTATLSQIRSMFGYVFETGQEAGGKPRIDLHPVSGRFEIGGLEIETISIWHGQTEVSGYRVGDFAYLTDCNRIPESSFGQLEGLQLLVLDALRYRPHPTHFSVSEAVDVARRIGAQRTLFTHLTHEVDYRRPEVELPPDMEFAWDGLEVDLA